MVDVERERNWWDAKAATEDEVRDDELVNRALRWREIERHLAGVRTVLDVGGGTGAFSIPLARRGLQVTHVDFSSEMLERARAKAEGVATIEFVQANAVDLSQFSDRAFDLVLNLDGAISFCGAGAIDALRESARCTARTLIVTVSHRAWMSAVWIAQSLEHAGDVLPAAIEMFERGRWTHGALPGSEAIAEGATQEYLGTLKSFLPDELAGLIRNSGLYVERVGGLGSLSLLAGREALQAVHADPAAFERFVELCDRYDREILPHGPGTRQRAGLIAVAHRTARR